MEASLLRFDLLSYPLAVRLVDFLILLLEAHSQTLQRLAALFSEGLVLEMLENAPEKEEEFTIHAECFESSSVSAAYTELEGAVREFTLPAILEFHLWAYPHYRAYIESSLELSDRMKSSPDHITRLADESITYAEAWLYNLPIAEEFRPRAQSAAQVPWIKFRTQVLKKAGHRPLGAV